MKGRAWCRGIGRFRVVPANADAAGKWPRLALEAVADLALGDHTLRRARRAVHRTHLRLNAVDHAPEFPLMLPSLAEWLATIVPLPADPVKTEYEIVGIRASEFEFTQPSMLTSPHAAVVAARVNIDSGMQSIDTAIFFSRTKCCREERGNIGSA